MSNFYNTLPLFFFMFGSGILYIITNTNYYYKFFDNEEKIEELVVKTKEVIIKKEIKYEDKYWDKYERMLKNKEENKEENKVENKEKNKEEKELDVEKNEINKNNILFETTPNGNVLMFYDFKRASFIYYADTTIPYRYLESVARKYVTTFFCLELYVDMKKAIADAEKKLNDKKEELERIELEKKEIEKKEEEEREKNGKDGKQETKEEKKNVFAKLKNYNTGSNTVVKGNKLAETNPNRATGANNVVNSTKEYILKENANRFSYEGKIVNYNLLNKPKRKIVEFSFADFKKMQKNK